MKKETVAAQKLLVSTLVSTSMQTLRRKINSKLAPILDAATPEMWQDIGALKQTSLDDEIARIGNMLKGMEGRGEYCRSGFE